jgi:adenosylhomocysteine nucleosidase
MRLEIGDIVIGTALIQHDMNASPLYPILEIPLLNKTRFETTHSRNLENALSQFVSNYDSFFNNEPEKFGIKSPKIYSGVILSGDLFVNASSQIEHLLQKVPEALCTEMEGAAVAQVCYEYNIPFQIVRIISDKADDNSHIDFPLFAGEVAGKYALGILQYYLKK